MAVLELILKQATLMILVKKKQKDQIQNVQEEPHNNAQPIHNTC